MVVRLLYSSLTKFSVFSKDDNYHLSRKQADLTLKKIIPMKKFVCLILIFFAAQALYLKAQNPAKPCQIISLSLKDGSNFLGVLEKSEKDSLWIKDFQLGKLVIPCRQINDSNSIFRSAFVEIQIADDRIFSGEIIRLSSDSMTISQENIHSFSIPLGSIKSIKKIKKTLPGTWSNDPNNTRYFFAPSAFMLKKGDGYYQNAYILSNSVSYGVSDHFTIGGGIILPVIFYITPKVGFSPGDYLHLGAGIIAGGTYLNSGIMAGIGYGLVTIGTRDYHLTMGAGYGAIYLEKAWQETRKPIFAFSGTARLNKRFSFVSENWVFQAAFEEEIEKVEWVNGMQQIYYENIPGVRKFVAACSGGGRFVWKKLALDLGVIAPVNFDEINIAVPYIDLVVKF